MTLRRLLWTGFGLGLLPRAPGTWGTLLGVALAGGAGALPGTHVVLLALVLVLFFAGAHLARWAAAETRRADPPSFVLDEVVGYLAAVLWLPVADRPWLVLGGAFVLFRVLDIAKPWPIGRLERAPGGWGVMLDDLAAGLIANAGLRISLLWL